MLRRKLIRGLLILLLCTGFMKAQTAAPTGAAQMPAKDPIDVKLQEALRERDAIIRNLLERVSELEWRLNGGFTTPAKVDERPVLTPASANRGVTAVAPSVV